MTSVFSRLLAGDATIVNQFAQAKAFWDTFFNNHRNESEADLAELLGNLQTQFYWTIAPQDYAFAKGIMPLTALGSLYDEINGFGANEAFSRRVARAFATSLVSIETKGAHLRFALAIYNLADALDQAA